MVSFNLLPKQHKEGLKKDSISRVLHIFAAFSVFWAMIFSTMLVAGIFFLSIQNEALEERIVSMQNMKETAEVEEIEANIIELNSMLLKIDEIKENKSYNAGVILSRIAPEAPEGISVNSIDFSSKTNIVLMSGHADQRIQVITFKDRLEEDPLFDEVESPLSNLLKSTDVDFKFTITLAEDDEK